MSADFFTTDDGMTAEALSPEAVAAELAALRATVSVLEAQLTALTQQAAAERRVSMRLAPGSPAYADAPYLGQPVPLLVTVRDGQGTPLPYAPVTLATTWGRVYAATAGGAEIGASVAARVGIDGTLRITLLAPVSDELYADQQDALETALFALDPDAATPAAMANGLGDFAREYRWEPNLELRAAVDLYFREFRGRLTETINARDYLRQWTYFDATVIAFAPDDEDNAVGANAALNIRFKDWLPPLLEVLTQVAQSESTLPASLGRLKFRNATNGAALQEDFYAEMRSFVEQQPGLLGEFTARGAVANAVQDFTLSLNELPPNSRTALLPAINAATGAVVAAGAKVFSALSQTRAELKQQIGTIEGGTLDPKTLNELKGRLTDVEVRMPTTASVIATIDQRLSQQLSPAITAALAGTLGDVEQRIASRFDALDQRLAGQFAGKLDVATFTSFDQGLNERLTQQVNAGLESGLATFRGEVEAQFVTLQGAVQGLDSSLAESDGRLSKRLETKLNAATFAAFEKGMDERLALQVSAGVESGLADFRKQTEFQFERLEGSLREVDSRLTDITKRFDGKLNVSDFVAFEQELDQRLLPMVRGQVEPLFKGLSDALDKRVVTLERSLLDVNTKLRLKLDAETLTPAIDSRLNERLPAIRDDLAQSFSGQLTEVRNGIAGLDSRLALKLDSDAFKTFSDGVGTQFEALRKDTLAIRNTIKRLPPIKGPGS